MFSAHGATYTGEGLFVPSGRAELTERCRRCRPQKLSDRNRSQRGDAGVRGHLRQLPRTSLKKRRTGFPWDFARLQHVSTASMESAESCPSSVMVVYVDPSAVIIRIITSSLPTVAVHAVVQPVQQESGRPSLCLFSSTVLPGPEIKVHLRLCSITPCTGGMPGSLSLVPCGNSR